MLEILLRQFFLMRVVFAGTPEFAQTILHGLLQTQEHDVVAVYTQPDRRSGRGQRLRPSPTKNLAIAHGISVEQPLNFKSSETVTTLSKYRPDVMVVAAYGLLLPYEVLDTPRLGCINVHASLLPRWRGAAPIQRAIQAHDRETGIAIMQMDTGLDTGDILTLSPCPIEQRDTAQSIHDRLARLGVSALLSTLKELESDTVTPQPQSQSGVTYARRIDKAEARIDWRARARDIDSLVRAFNPSPIAFSYLNDQRIRIWNTTHSTYRPAPMASTGTLLQVSREGIEVATGNGALRLTHLQFPGRKALPVKDLLNAIDFRTGTQFR